MHFRSIFFLGGQLLTALAFALLVPWLVDSVWMGQKQSMSFGMSFGISFTVGVAFILATRSSQAPVFHMREAFVFTAFVWFVLPLFAALPFYIALSIPYVDAYFEAVSAITTTGASVFRYIERVPPSILLWRSILQWLGGTGIVVMAMTLLPILRVGGALLLRSEFSDRSEKILPRVSQMASGVLIAYCFFTVVCWIALMLCDMSVFDSVCHAMATVSTGGMSNKGGAFLCYESKWIEWITMFFMFLGGSTFMLFVRWWKGDHRSPWHDYQWRFYCGWIVVWIVALTFWHISQTSHHYWTHCLHASAFTVVSIATSTGFMINDALIAQGAFPQVIMFVLMCVGGCTGSTTGGIKIFRLQVLWIVMRTHLRHIRRPHSVAVPLYQGQKISDFISVSVFSFLVLYIVSLVLLSLGLSLLGLDSASSLSAAASSLGNTGPIMSQGSYVDMSQGMKLLLSVGMIVGRLELITIVMILMPSFWRA